MSTPSTVLFDLDGTLLDTWSLHLRCLRAVAGQSAARVAAAQRPTDLGTISALVGDQDAERMLQRYHEALCEELALTGVPEMPNASEVLAALRNAGIAAGVCTGRSRAGATALLDASNLPVALLTAREDAQRPKPSGDGVRLALTRTRQAAGTVVYVGDAEADVQEGAAAGVRTVLLRGGRPGRTTSAAEVINDLSELLPLIGV